MSDEQATNSAAVEESTSAEQPDKSGEQPAAPEDKETQTAKAEQPEGGKKLLKVPDSLKPKVSGEGKAPGWVQQRLSHYARERDELRAKLAVYEGGKSEKAASQKTADGPPKEEDFENYKDYLIAAAKYDFKQEQAAERKQQEEQNYNEYVEHKRQEFSTHAAPIVEQVPEFWDAISDPTLPVSEAMKDAVLELGEMGPYTMLWLASHRQEAAKMYRLPPRAATVAIGRLALQLEQEIQAAETDSGSGDHPGMQTTPQHQPKPVPQIRGGSPGNIDQNPSDKMSTRDWMIAEAKRERAKNPNARVYFPK